MQHGVLNGNSEVNYSSMHPPPSNQAEDSQPEIEVIAGKLPIILTQPHAGTWLPAALHDRLQSHALALRDTDWHIPRLYADLLPAATIVRTPVHRYVIDVNRPPDNAPMYPGSHGTGLCPLTDFDGNALYQPGMQPESDEIGERLRQWHRPYHDAIASQIRRLQQTHAEVLVYDCHSIRSQIPSLFTGVLPLYNIGSFDDRSCAPELTATVAAVCARAGQASSDKRADASGFDHVVNGRFRGGHTTRHYGHPEAGIHALQMELAQRAYMQEQPPWQYHEPAANTLRQILREVLQQALLWLERRQG